jgi:hypothetical protein
MVIAANPDRLRDVARRLGSAGRDIDREAGRLNAYYGELQWEVRQQADLEGFVAELAKGGRLLAGRADGMSQLLTAAAEAFERLDVQGESNFDKIVAYIMDGVGELMQYNPLANIPLDRILSILSAGNLQQVARILAQSIPLPNLYFSAQLLGGALGGVTVLWDAKGGLKGQGAGLPAGVQLGSVWNNAQGLLDGIDKDLADRLRRAGLPVLQPGSVSGALAGAVGSIGQFGASAGVGAGGALIGQRWGDDQAFVSATALGASASALGYLRADALRGQVAAGVAVEARLDAARIQAGMQGRVGDDTVGAGAGLHGDASAGAQTYAHAGLQADLARGLISGQAGGEAFVGAQATAQGRAEGTLAGVTMAANGHASARVGFGVSASVGGNVDLASGKISANFQLGATLGIGADIAFGFEIDAGKAVENVKNAIVNAIPKIELPKIELPKLELPKIEPPGWWPWK